MVEEVENVRTVRRDEEQEVEVLRQYDDGTKLLGILLIDEISWTRGGDTGFHDRYRIVAADGQSRDIVGGINMHRRRIAQELAELFYRFGFIHETRDDIVPLAVAIDGKPAIAAYLNAVRRMSLEEVSSKMGLTGKTAYLYVDHFKEGRR